MRHILQRNRIATPRSIRNFERLETRYLLAGNVVANFTGGLLSLSGDGAANAIQVSQLANGDWQVKGIGTKVNGSNAAQTFSGVTDFASDLARGSDALYLSGGTFSGDCTIQDSFGNNLIQLKNVHARNFDVETGDGNDVVTATGCNADTNFNIYVANGVNSVIVKNCFADSTLSVSGNEQTDVFQISGTRANIIAAGGFERTAVISITNCQAAAGIQSEVENLDDPRAVSSMLISDCTTGGELQVAYTDGTAVVTVRNLSAEDGIDIRPAGNANAGREIINVLNSTTPSDLTIGTLPKSVVNVSHAQAIIAQIFGSADSTINVNGLTTQFSNNIIGGFSAVTVANSHFNTQGPPTTSTSLLIETGTSATPTSTTVLNCTLNGTLAIDGSNQADIVSINKVVASGIRADLAVGRDLLTVVNSTASFADFDGGGNPGDTLIKSHNHFGTETDNGFQYVIG